MMSGTLLACMHALLGLHADCHTNMLQGGVPLLPAGEGGGVCCQLMGGGATAAS
jgi:hypothetical protein